MYMDQAYHEAKDLGIVLDSKWPLVGWDEKRKDGGKLITACKRWCKLTNEPYRAVSSPITFQRSYAQGFLNEVRFRFAALRKYREQQVASTTGAELVLFDRNKAVRDAMEELKRLLGHKDGKGYRSAEHTSALKSLMRSSYAVFC